MYTKLEAVNQCLQAIGESPISSLASGLDDAGNAQSVVEDVTKKILADGWHVNTNFGVTLKPDLNGKIAVPINTLRLDTSSRSKHINVTVRRDPNDGVKRLFNLLDQTFVISRSLVVDIILDMDFDDLTPELQFYIATRSARIFQEGVIGSANLDAFTRRQEQEAWTRLQIAEAELEDTNLFQTNPDLHWIVARHRPLY